MEWVNFLHFTPFGLVLDACGVLLLGFAFFLKSVDSMIEESGTTWDSTAYKPVAAGKSDGIFGSSLLFIGFIFQALGYVGAESINVSTAGYLILIIFLILYFCFIRAWLVKKWVAAIEDKINGE